MSTFDEMKAAVLAGDYDAAQVLRPRTDIPEDVGRKGPVSALHAFISANFTIAFSQAISRHPRTVELTPDQLASVVRFAIECGFLKGFTASGETTI